MKSRNVIEKEQCPMKYQYGVLNSSKGKTYYNGMVIKEVLNQHGLDFTEEDIEDVIQNTIPGSCFQTKRENAFNVELLMRRLLRFQEYFKNEIIHANTEIYGSKAVNIIHNITVDYSFLLKTGNQVFIYKVKNKKNMKLKARGQSIFTKISDSMELYLLQLAGEKLYPNAHVTAGIVFLVNPKDKERNLVSVSEFHEKANDTIVEYHFNQNERDKMNERMENIMNDNIQKCEKKCNECIYNGICNYVDNAVSLKPISIKPKTIGKVKFTDHQEKVISREQGVYRVLAGAGSGKTTCIANRIATLVEKGYNLKDILLITFTTKGVEEMKEKIEYWLGMNQVSYDKKDLNIFTFNSFGYELIKKEYKNFGYTKIPDLFEKSDSLNCIKELLDNNNEISRYNYINPFMETRYAKGAVYQASEDFDKLKQADVTFTDEVMEILDIEDEIVAEKVLELYHKYNDYMKSHNLIDYNDQVQLAFKILSKPTNVKKYGYIHIICDEFQDSDNLQINILKLLSEYKYNESVMVVGDDSQAIFSWRGATSDNILNFHKYFKNTSDIELVENFRSSIEICNLANKINDLNKNKVDKSLVGVFHGEQPKLQYGKLVNLVDTVMYDIQKKNIPYSDIAIIARTKSSLLEARDILLANNIPCVLSVSEFLVDNQSMQHIADFFEFLIDNTLDLYFAKFLQVKDYETFMKESQKALFYKYLEDEKEKFLKEYTSYTDDKKFEFILEILDEIGKRDNAIKSLVKIIRDKGFETIEETNQYIQNMMLYKSDNMVDVNEEPVDAITLTTAHSSKGKEWEHVYMCLDKFKYPSAQDYYELMNEPVVEEERRLLFVGITRAKKYLTMVGTGTIYEEIATGLGIKSGQQNIV